MFLFIDNKRFTRRQIAFQVREKKYHQTSLTNNKKKSSAIQKKAITPVAQFTVSSARAFATWAQDELTTEEMRGAQQVWTSRREEGRAQLPLVGLAPPPTGSVSSATTHNRCRYSFQISRLLLRLLYFKITRTLILTRNKLLYKFSI